MHQKRIVFFVSDRTGITAEAMGRTLLTQFDHIEFERHTLPFIDTEKRAQAALEWINQAARQFAKRPLVFCTLTDPGLRAIVEKADAFFMDFFDAFITPLEQELGVASSRAIGKAHGMGQDYLSRIDAVNYAMGHDDGLGARLDSADIILIGVSRCGKTPTCLYLALHYGLHAANYPLTPDDFAAETLPQTVRPYRDKLFGLSIDADRLAQIRRERRPNSQYATLSNCRTEVRQAEALFRSHGIPWLDTTAMSIEELASRIVHKAGLENR